MDSENLFSFGKHYRRRQEVAFRTFSKSLAPYRLHKSSTTLPKRDSPHRPRLFGIADCQFSEESDSAGKRTMIGKRDKDQETY